MSNYKIKIRPSKKAAINAVCYMALHVDRCVTIKEISEAIRVSVSYLEQIFKDLKRGGIAAPKKGPSGGYKLALMPSEISVFSVLRCVDASFCCEIDINQSKINESVDYVFNKTSETFENSLKSISILDVVDCHNKK